MASLTHGIYCGKIIIRKSDHDESSSHSKRRQEISQGNPFRDISGTLIKSAYKRDDGDMDREKVRTMMRSSFPL